MNPEGSAMLSRSRTFVGVVCALLLLSPCASRAQTPNERAQLMKDLQARRDGYASQLKEMDIRQLAARVEVDSLKGREPFNSMAYAELVSRGSQIAVELRALLTKADHTSLLGLLALRRMDDATYQAVPSAFRIAVFADSLRVAKTFNAWGLPGALRSNASDAFIAEGRSGDREAVQALTPLMRDKRPAPSWGSEDAMLTKTYRFRVCDYAWAIVMAMRQEKITIARDPEQRDILIAKALSEP
jgi:hypothetical protein